MMPKIDPVLVIAQIAILAFELGCCIQWRRQKAPLGTWPVWWVTLTALLIMGSYYIGDPGISTFVWGASSMCFVVLIVSIFLDWRQIKKKYDMARDILEEISSALPAELNELVSDMQGKEEGEINIDGKVIDVVEPVAKSNEEEAVP